MNRETSMTALQGTVLGTVLSLGGTGCLISAFSLSVPSPWALYLCCGASAAVSALLLTRRLGWLGLLALAVTVLGLLWHKTALEYQLWQLVYRISAVYNRAYDCGVFQLVDTPWDAGTAELPLAVLGGLLAASVNVSLALGRGAGTSAALGILALAPCLVVTDTVPSPGFLFLLLAGVFLLLLTGHARAGSPHQGNRLVLLAALPVCVTLGLLFALLPQEGYVNRSQELRDTLAVLLEDPPTAQEITQSFTVVLRPAQPDTLELDDLGQLRETGEAVMEVTSDSGGALYLRGRDYDLYDGTGWTATRHRVEPFTAAGPDLGRITIRTRRELEEVYLPYYPGGEYSLIGGRLENTRLETAYTFTRTGLPPAAPMPSGETVSAGVGTPEDAEYLEFVRRYTTLPNDTLPGVRELLEGLLPGDSLEENAHAIRDFVRGSALYDLNPDRMPPEGADFALWFLTEAERGYCVHFAASAAVLLRAAGIPARYVSGYMITAAPGETVTVTTDQAHAWAEYYDSSRGCWVILEATPVMDREPAVIPPEQTRPAPSAPTVPSEPEASAAPEPTVPETLPEPETTVPQTLPAQAASEEQPSALPGLALCLLLSVFAAAEAQRLLRQSLRKRRLTQGSANQQALARWQELLRLSKIRGSAPPPELEMLANKAKFSQHTLTAEEIAVFDNRILEIRRDLQNRRWYQKLLSRYLHGE